MYIFMYIFQMVERQCPSTSVIYVPIPDELLGVTGNAV